MPTDANILLGLKPMQTTNPAEMYEVGQRIESNRLTGLMNNMKMDEYQRGVADQNSLRDVYKTFGDNATDNTNKLYSAGLGKQAGEYAKSAADLAKDNATTGKTRLEATGLALTQHRDQVNMIQSPDDVKRWVAAGYNNPDLKPIFERYGTMQEAFGKIDAGVTNPQQLAQWKINASTNAETLLKQISPDANARLQSDTTLSTNANTVDQQERSSLRVDKRSQESTAATVGKPFEVTGPDGKPVLVQQDKQGNITPVSGYTPKTSAIKPMPGTAMKMQDEDLQAIGTFGGLNADLAGLQKQIADGKLKFGPLGNKVNDLRNYMGQSDEESRNFASFKSKMENLRNSVLLLNKGVQTEGDAQRAMNEIMANLNDQGVVTQRLAEIDALNKRAVELRKNNIGVLRRNYGQEDMDFSKYDPQPGATNLPKAGGASAVKPDASAFEAEARRRGMVK